MFETVLEKITDKDCDYADPACMLLSNLTRSVFNRPSKCDTNSGKRD